ncbi:MAG: cyclic nucleotide-binding domain-containing protein [Hymenobacter sp.]
MEPFNLLPAEVLEEVAALLHEVTHPREAVIYRQGETKLRGVDLIIEGGYDTFFYDGQQARRLPETYGPGACYGGVSVLLNKKRSLRTVQAQAGTRVYFCTAAVFGAVPGLRGVFPLLHQPPRPADAQCRIRRAGAPRPAGRPEFHCRR